jgi:hypothetical protein
MHIVYIIYQLKRLKSCAARKKTMLRNFHRFVCAEFLLEQFNYRLQSASVSAHFPFRCILSLVYHASSKNDTSAYSCELHFQKSCGKLVCGPLLQRCPLGRGTSSTYQRGISLPLLLVISLYLKLQLVCQTSLILTLLVMT